jgi:predicted transcriptional regulator
MPLPACFDSLGPRQQEVVRVVYSSGGATIKEIYTRIPDPPPSICGIRTLLKRMIKKGILRTRRSGRHREILYLPGECGPAVQLRAFDRLADEHFGGSAARALIALATLAANEASQGSGPEARAA